jgi:pimeloyl-ACP methyl ester carboxylesterase
VVLIPGLGGLASFWREASKTLDRRFRLISFDHRGTGRSDRPEQDYSNDLLASDVLRILDELRIERAYIVGHSTGGAIAQTLGLDAADRVKGLVLSGTWSRPDYRFKLLFETRLAVLEHAGPRAHAALGQLLGFPSDWINENERSLRGALETAEADTSPISVSAARMRMLLDYDRHQELSCVTAPTLVIGSADDAIVPSSLARDIARAIPNAQYVEMSGGHFFPRTMPEAFARTVSEFLENLS